METLKHLVADSSGLQRALLTAVEFKPGREANPITSPELPNVVPGEVNNNPGPSKNLMPYIVGGVVLLILGVCAYKIYQRNQQAPRTEKSRGN
jgi:hypothetical protein